MAWIDLQNDLPGIRGPMIYRPDTGAILNDLAEALLHDENNSLSISSIFACLASSINRSATFCVVMDDFLLVK